MRAEPGTYAVIFRCPAPAQVQVGRLGTVALRKGYYVYVGSAFGPGGVRARVARHCRQEKRRRWHIDYLRDFVEPLGAWFSHEPRHLEHQWAGSLGSLPGAQAIGKFGCSDCRCGSHLFYFAARPALAPFRRAAGASVDSWVYR